MDGRLIISDCLQCQHKAGEDKEETEVESGEHLYIVTGFAGVVLGVLGEGDKACQGSDQGAGAADIHANQKVCVVTCELGQKNCGGDIADELAGQNGKQERTLVHQEGEQVANRGDPGHVSCENEEEYKGKKQGGFIKYAKN